MDLAAAPAAYGPYWALLVGTLGVGAYLAGRLDLDRRWVIVALAVVLAATPLLLVFSRNLPVVVAAQTVLALVLAILGIHAGRSSTTGSRRAPSRRLVRERAPSRGCCSCPSPS